MFRSCRTHKRRLQTKVGERYQNFFEKEKERKLRYGGERHRYLSENEGNKKKIAEYRKNFVEGKKCLS